MKPIVKMALRGVAKGPGQAVAIAVAGAAARRFLDSRNKHATKQGPVAEAEDWMIGVMEEAKKWLRENHVPEHLKEFAEALISPSSRIVDAKAVQTEPVVEKVAEPHRRSFLRR